MLLIVWLTLGAYMMSHWIASADEDFEAYTFPLIMAAVPILLHNVEGERHWVIEATLFIRSLKGVAVALVFLWWADHEDDRDPHYTLYLCGMAVFFLLRFVATFPIPWRSFIAGMSKVFETVYGAVRSAGSRV
ncbi:hypothetical protein BC826DRAFT_1046341 [Russula brevipes]|nr:hypothetical protein BC826DRAFT_1046341 [Russula brevipes]